MTKADLGLALIVLITVAGFVAYVYLFPLRRERRKTQRYPLFACRNRIVMLVADGKITEDDEVFQFLYQSVNYLIPQAKELGRMAIVRAILASPLSKLTEEEFRVRFVETLNHDDKEVRRVAREFFLALRAKLAKAWSVRLALAFIGWGLHAAVLAADKLAPKGGGSPRDGALLYETLGETAAELAAA